MTTAEQNAIERGTWTGNLDFFLSAVGYAVGIGNVWRFPYLAYKNGGASFLFPYIIMLLVAGLPLFFIELSIGQFTSQGPMTCWQMAPLFTGIGYAMVAISAVTAIYYNMIITYAIYYMLVSFVNLDEKLPWEECGQEWNTGQCRSEAIPRLDDPMYTPEERWNTLWDQMYNRSCVDNKRIATTYEDFNAIEGTSEMYTKFVQGFTDQFNSSVTDNLTVQYIQDYTGFDECRIQYTTPSEEYLERFVLKQHLNVDLNDIGDISLKLILTLFAAWLLIFGCLMKGIKTSGKVVYFTATFPFVVLIVLFIRGLTLEGMEEGVKFYVIPEWSKLTDATIWGDAASQIFYSLGIGFGGLITMASYNKFTNNCYRDAILVSFINCCTSIFAGFAIFSMLGHMAYVTNKKVEDVTTSGIGLAFVAYPDGISKLPVSPVWAFLFFFMLLTLGMDSQFAMMETILSALSDIFPKFLRQHKTSFTFIACLIGFALGIPQTTSGGIRVVTLMNDYSGSYNLLILAFFEIVCLCYVYGLRNFQSDIEMMIGFKPKYYWIAMWMVITPIVIVFIVIVSAVQYKPSVYDGRVILTWAEGIGWLMVVFPLGVFVLVGLIQFYRLGYPACIKPTNKWGPALLKDRTGRYASMDSPSDLDLNDVEISMKNQPPPYSNGDTGKGHDNVIFSEHM